MPSLVVAFDRKRVIDITLVLLSKYAPFLFVSIQQNAVIQHARFVSTRGKTWDYCKSE